MNSAIFKRYSLFIALGLLLILFIVLVAYDVIKVDFVSFMEIQPAYQPMYDPLPVPTDSIPIEGPAYIAALGAPSNPIPADQASIARGNELFHIICTTCHGPLGKGDGPVANYL